MRLAWTALAVGAGSGVEVASIAVPVGACTVMARKVAATTVAMGIVGGAPGAGLAQATMPANIKTPPLQILILSFIA